MNIYGSRPDPDDVSAFEMFAAATRSESLDFVLSMRRRKFSKKARRLFEERATLF